MDLDKFEYKNKDIEAIIKDANRDRRIKHIKNTVISVLSVATAFTIFNFMALRSSPDPTFPQDNKVASVTTISSNEETKRDINFDENRRPSPKKSNITGGGTPQN